MSSRPNASQDIHGTTVSVDGRGIILLGKSGRGKSALAVQLLAMGAELVADDRTCLSMQPDGLIANAPDAIKGLIEARGVGLITLPYVQDIPIYLAVDLDDDETNRLPYPHEITLLGHVVPCLRRSEGPHFAASLFLYLKTMKPT